MLGGDGVPGNLPDAVRDITINRKADALFFMLAARADRPLADWEKRDRKRAELCRYLIHYADGQTVELPIYLGEDVDSYKQNTPRALPGAQIAWTRPYAGGEYQAVLYVKQWDNPRPGVAIKSVDLTYGAERRGVPALVALTAATVPVSRGK
jgi:beta-galactosidase